MNPVAPRRTSSSTHCIARHANWLRLLLIMPALGLSGCETPAPQAAEKIGDYNRMERVQVPGIEQVYRKQGADLSGYTSVMLDEPLVSFRENWRPEDDPSLTGVDLPDLATVRKRLSQQFQQALSTKLQEGGGYPVIAAPAPNVLQVKAELNDLYISSSAIRTAAGGEKPYYMEFSEVTLVMELRDSATGALLYRAYDHRSSRDKEAVQLDNGNWNSPALRGAMDYWASMLRRSLDAVRSRK